jgi:hypothetical protein
VTSRFSCFSMTFKLMRNAGSNDKKSVNNERCTYFQQTLSTRTTLECGASSVFPKEFCCTPIFCLDSCHNLLPVSQNVVSDGKKCRPMHAKAVQGSTSNPAVRVKPENTFYLLFYQFGNIFYYCIKSFHKNFQ